MYARRRERRRIDAGARSMEAMGDTAVGRFAYIEAYAYYERALAQTDTAQDEVRLFEKIGHSLFYGARPDFATLWYERAIERCSKSEALQEPIPELLFRLTIQRWLESRTLEVPQLIERACELFGSFGNVGAIERGRAAMSDYLILLGRYDEALRVSKEPRGALRLKDDSHAKQLNPHFKQMGVMCAVRGNADEAFRNFDRAVEFSKPLLDGYATTVTWDDYANCAMELGRVDIARVCREHALLVARERRISWRIPYLTLRFASLLITIGDYEHAKGLISDAMTYDTETPVLHVLCSTVRVTLALAVGDGELLGRAFEQNALELAFRSGEPARIAAIAAAYAKTHVANKDVRRAKECIVRGVAAMMSADHAGELLSLAAQYAPEDVALRAKKLLHDRLKLPHHHVAQAFLALWETRYALRRRSPEEARAHGEKAAKAFARLGWKHLRDETLTAIGIHGNRSQSGLSYETSTLSGIGSVLTKRERQVAELVLRGLSNRAVAEMLSISEHTVEAHMTSILNRLGLRSRWQLHDLASA
jgi:ATP/maltotriose-dependent transcriptional regulator MalT